MNYLLLLLLTPSPAADLPPIAKLDYQAQPRAYNEICMHVAECNGLRAIEFQVTNKDPGDLSPRFVGLSAVQEGWLPSPDSPFGCVGAARLAMGHGSCLLALCPADATAKTQAAIDDANTRRTTGFVFCETMLDVRNAFDSGPCTIVVNRFGHAWTIVGVMPDGRLIVVDPFPDWTGRGNVGVWSPWFSELLITLLPDYEVVALTGWRN